MDSSAHSTATPLHADHPRQPRDKDFFIISKLPQHFSWQRLKDLVRAAPGHDPGWTSISKSPYDREGARALSASNRIKMQPAHTSDAASYLNSRLSTPHTAALTAAAVQTTLHWKPTPPLGTKATPAQYRGSTVPVFNPQLHPPSSQPTTYWWPCSAKYTRMNMYNVPFWHGNGRAFTTPETQYLSSLSPNLARPVLPKLPQRYASSTATQLFQLVQEVKLEQLWSVPAE